MLCSACSAWQETKKAQFCKHEVEICGSALMKTLDLYKPQTPHTQALHAACLHQNALALAEQNPEPYLLVRSVY